MTHAPGDPTPAPFLDVNRRRFLQRAGLAVVAVPLVGTTLLAGCADDDLTSVYPADQIVDLTGKSKVDVNVTDNAFTPRYVKISVGTTVRWTNYGNVTHNVRPAEGSAFPKTDVIPGATVSYAISQVGKLPYYCTIHGTPHKGQHGLLWVVAE